MSRQFFDLHSEPFEPIEPGDAAGGDLAGSYPDPMVVGLRNVALSTSAASAEYVLTATGPSDAQWLPPATSIESFATIAAMSAFDDARLSDGSLVYVQTLRSYFQKREVSPVPATDGITIVALSTGDGAWYRVGEASLSWASQVTWYIDPAAGNDQNDGATSAAGGAGAGYVGALKTWAEFTRRIHMVFAPMTVTILSNIGEPLIGNFASGGATAGLVIAGQPTVLASGGGPGHSTLTDPVIASNTRGLVSVDNLLTSGGAAANLSDYVGRMLRCPADPASLAAGEFVAPVLRASGNDANVPWWARVNITNTKPTNGTLVEVLSLVTCPSVQITTSSLPVQVRYLSLTSTDARLIPLISNYLSLDVQSSSPSVWGTWFGCIFPNIIASSPGERSNFFGCLLTAAITITYPLGGRMLLLGGGARGSVQHSSSGIVAFQGFVIEGGKLQVGNSSLQSPSATVDVVSTTTPLGVFGSTGNAVEVTGGSRLRAGSLFGSNNTGFGVSVATGGDVFISGTPYITGGGDLQINGAVTAVPPPSSLGIWQAAADLSGSGGVGWGKWASAPFSRNVMSYANGSRICGS